MPLDLEVCSPEHVATHASLAELLEAVNARETLSERMAEVLEYVYCERLLKLVRTNAPREQLEALADHLLEVAHPVRRAALEGLSRPYLQRWSLLRELLERRIESLRSDVPRQVLQREHVLPILRYVAEARGPVGQQDIQKDLELGKANLSRILGLMESNELIDKQAQGNANLIVLGPRGRELMPTASPALPPPAPATRPSVSLERGASYLDPQSFGPM
jgi:DNA-binding MarR family transcriptional regulator